MRQLHNLGLTGPIPSEIGKLTQLMELRMSKNKLTSLPPEIGNVTRLTYLYVMRNLSQNPLNCPLPEDIGDLVSVREICSLQGPLPTSLGKLVNLLKLDLRSNYISGPVPKEIAGLMDLTHLDLSLNNLEMPPPPEFRDMKLLVCYLNQRKVKPSELRGEGDKAAESEPKADGDDDAPQEAQGGERSDDGGDDDKSHAPEADVDADEGAEAAAEEDRAESAAEGGQDDDSPVVSEAVSLIPRPTMQQRLPQAVTACKAARACAAALVDIETNRHVVTVMRQHAADLANILANTISSRSGARFGGPEAPPSAAVATLEAITSVLGQVQRYVVRQAAKNPLRQLLQYKDASVRIASLHGQIADYLEALQIGAALDKDMMLLAMRHDQDQIPLLAPHVCNADVVQSQFVETLSDIDLSLETRLADLPERVRSVLAPGLQAAFEVVRERTGRSVAPSKLWTLEPSEIDFLSDQPIGHGSLGPIFRARHMDRDFAVQAVPLVKGQSPVDVFAAEVEAWFVLRHPNVLGVWRVCINADEPYLVTPLMLKSLSSYLQCNERIAMPTRMGFIFGIAKGMRYLHGLPVPIVHGDLRASNVLLGYDGEVAITDVGMSLTKAHCKPSPGRQSSSIRWVAPERYRRGYKPAPPLDVFAFAMTCWEVITGRAPFFEEPEDEIVKDWIRDGERPDRPAGVPDVLWDVMQDCWLPDPEKRPTFIQIVHRLSIMPTAKGLNEPATVLKHTRSASPTDSVLHLDANGDGDMSWDEMNSSFTAAAIRASAAIVPMEIDNTAPRSPHENIADIMLFLRLFPSIKRRFRITKDNWNKYSATMDVGDWLAIKRQAKPKLANDDKGRITVLSLTDGDITGPIPGGIMHLEELRAVHIRKNSLNCEIPPELGSLKHLISLNLSDNKLWGPIPREFGNLTTISKLVLVSNRLSGPIPPELGHLTNLTELSLSSNRFTGEIPRELGNLRNLTHLLLSSNQLTGSIPPELGNLTKLNVLYLNSNHLIGPIPLEIFHLSQLEAMYLGHNRLTGPIPRYFSNLKRLTHLDVSVNHFDLPLPDELLVMPLKLFVWNQRKVRREGEIESMASTPNPARAETPVLARAETPVPVRARTPITARAETPPAGAHDMEL
nr:hypothetical protein HK105_004522 [Polyrhizophydium stewartii]